MKPTQRSQIKIPFECDDERMLPSRRFHFACVPEAGETLA